MAPTETVPKLFYKPEAKAPKRVHRVFLQSEDAITTFDAGTTDTRIYRYRWNVPLGVELRNAKVFFQEFHITATDIASASPGSQVCLFSPTFRHTGASISSTLGEFICSALLPDNSSVLRTIDSLEHRAIEVPYVPGMIQFDLNIRITPNTVSQVDSPNVRRLDLFFTIEEDDV